MWQIKVCSTNEIIHSENVLLVVLINEYQRSIMSYNTKKYSEAKIICNMKTTQCVFHSVNVTLNYLSMDSKVCQNINS